MEDELNFLYQRVFKVAKHFLDQSKLFTVQELSQHNEPTYEQFAEYANLMASTIGAIAEAGGWDEERISLNARQAALLMEKMALCIANHDQDGLKAAEHDLEKMSFV
ncbi:hypothetical protein AB733_19995 [Photobacterium swingsii]|uniref:Uncharacterized protein n=1 Tax=Photobacterium swingsii TaxID=680026 RepID=A0A0J8V797_9GAMM|nr:hypothetical protein [Photobacterium swingsii]KMV29062.1 hypothetical protein AB733_19995 [Photobacterium swingsii]PSW19117.1 hypothetical protein C9I94_23895 [Photobacterium swingsii]